VRLDWKNFLHTDYSHGKGQGNGQKSLTAEMLEKRRVRVRTVFSGEWGGLNAVTNFTNFTGLLVAVSNLTNFAIFR